MSRNGAQNSASGGGGGGNYGGSLMMSGRPEGSFDSLMERLAEISAKLDTWKHSLSRKHKYTLLDEPIINNNNNKVEIEKKIFVLRNFDILESQIFFLVF